jgi:predicted nuclease with TOPRIM domain
MATKEVESIKEDLEVALLENASLKKKLKEAQGEIEEVREGEREALREITAAQAREATTLHQFELADALFLDLIAQKTRLEESLSTQIPKFLGSNAFKYATQAAMQDSMKY